MSHKIGTHLEEKVLHLVMFWGVLVPRLWLLSHNPWLLENSQPWALLPECPTAQHDFLVQHDFVVCVVHEPSGLEPRWSLGSSLLESLGGWSWLEQGSTIRLESLSIYNLLKKKVW